MSSSVGRWISTLCFLDLSSHVWPHDFHFCYGVVKSILCTLANFTLWKVGNNRKHGRDFELNWRLVILLASAANNSVATWKHASPNPAMQLQWEHNTSPSPLMAIQILNGATDKLWECLSTAKNKYFFCLPIGNTVTLLTWPFIKKLVVTA